jgi:hypothetical protein
MVSATAGLASAFAAKTSSLRSDFRGDQDTNSVIAAYNMSGFWPLHALASDLAEFLINTS